MGVRAVPKAFLIKVRKIPDTHICLRRYYFTANHSEYEEILSAKVSFFLIANPMMV